MAFPGKFYREGNRLKLQNSGGDPKLFFIEEFSLIHYLNDEIFSWFDKIIACGANGMRTLGIYVYDKGQEEEPFVRSGGGFDLNRFNEPFFDYMRRWAKYACDCGIAVHYDLFDNCLFWVPEFTPYDPFYQLVQGDAKAFTNLGNTPVIDAQKRYVRKVVETLNPFPNVIFGIMNEYIENGEWHAEMSRYIKSLAPDHLVAGSMETSPACGDPSADLWYVHTGTRDFLETGVPSVAKDIAKLSGDTGHGKALGFSNDGFGDAGPRETPDDMRRLTYDAVSANIQLMAFMDHLAWIPVPGKLGPLNEATYRAIAEVFRPYPPATKGKPQPLQPKVQFKLDDRSFVSLQKKNVPADILKKLQILKNKEYISEADFLKAVEGQIGKDAAKKYKTLLLQYASLNRPVEGYLDIFRAANLPSTHPQAIVERGGKAIRATTTEGFLCYGQYKKGYPTVPLQALFSVLADNNSADDRYILIIDVYDHASDRVLGKRVISRKDFPKANEFCLFTFNFTPPSKDSNMEFRIYYMGYSYILADKIAIINPAEIKVNNASEIPDSLTSIPTPGSTPTPPVGTTPTGNLAIDDPLTNGRCAGRVVGGEFTAEGCRITAEKGYIIYETDIRKQIRVEFDAKGYLDREPSRGTDDNAMLFVMHDAEPDTNWAAAWRDLPNYLYQIRKIGLFIENGQPLFTTNGISFKAGCAYRNVGVELASWNGGDCLAGHPVEWNPSKRYHWVITVSNGRTEIVRDGVKMFSIDCATAFNPDNRLLIYIGGATYGPYSPRNVTYSNVKIYRV